VSWLLPGAVGFAAAAALIVVALHFIARGSPRPEAFPTARFVPPRTARARARSIALSDVALLAIRVAAVVAIGAGVAGPLFRSRRTSVARVVLVDRSRAVATLRDAIDSARAYTRPGDLVIVFDSAAARATAAALASVTASNARGSLSAGLAAAVRLAAGESFTADSVELVVISPFAGEELDSATAAIRAVWPGRARVVSLAAAPAASAAPGIALSSNANDPTGSNDAIVAGFELAGAVRAPAGARLVRGRVTSSDTAWARGGGMLLHWPATDADALWPKRATIDAVGAVESKSGVMVARFPRLWSLAAGSGGSVVARWVDGEPAAIEQRVGSGCIRDVSVLVDPASDVTLHASFAHFAAALLAPCGGFRDTRPDRKAKTLVAGGGALAAATMLRARAAAASQVAPWLVGLGILLLLIELAARRPARASALARDTA
jgi:hypothetical protein